MNEFLQTFPEQLEASEFYKEYLTKFPEAETENTVNILNNLFEQLYLGTEYVEKFTIMSYATGQGFLEACFAYWLINTGKCLTCNIMYSDPVISIDDLKVYGIFTIILNYAHNHNLYGVQNMILNNHINGIGKKKITGIIDLYKDTVPNIFLSFAGQDYICKHLEKCKHIKILHEYINLMNNVSLIVFNKSILTSNMIFCFLIDDLYVDMNTLLDIRDVLKDKEHTYSKVINDKMYLGNYVHPDYTDKHINMSHSGNYVEKSFSTISELSYITRLSYTNNGYAIIENLDALPYLSKYRLIKEKLK